MFVGKALQKSLGSVYALWRIGLFEELILLSFSWEIRFKERVLTHHRSGHEVDRPSKVPIASFG